MNLSLANTVTEALFSRLTRGRADAVEPVGIRCGNRGAYHEPRFLRRPGSAAMQRRAVVPYHHVTLAPRVHVAEPRRGCGIDALGKKALRGRLLRSLDRIGVRGDVQRRAAV